MSTSKSDSELDGSVDSSQHIGSTLELGRVKQVISTKMVTPAEHYTSLKPLGKGSFGAVHSGLDTLLGREVAIKSLKKQFRDEQEVVDRFLKEARGTAQLEHPNIMPVHDVGMDDELGLYFTMKKVEGENLREVMEHLEANTSFYIHKYPIERLLEIFVSICNGVAFAHSKGVIHRDLKPANVMIGEFGEVVILDWGLVKRLDVEEAETGGVHLRMDEFDDGSSTMAGAISGTPNFMSPEQAEGLVDEVDFQSDVYSLGALLYNMLTYRVPFERMRLNQLLENVSKGNFEAPRKRRPDLNIPRELEAICLKAMSRFQVNRYRSVEDLISDIRRYRSHRPVSAYKAPRHIRFLKTCRRNPIKSSVLIAALFALIASVIVRQAMYYGSYQQNVAKADLNRTRMEELIESAKERYMRLKDLTALSQLREQSSEEVALKKELEDITVEVNYLSNLAVGYYEGVPKQYRMSKLVKQGYGTVIQKQIEYAMLRDEYSTAYGWVSQIEERHPDWRKTFSEETKEYIRQVGERIEGYGSVLIKPSPNLERVEIYQIIHGELRSWNGEMIEGANEFPYLCEPLTKGSYVLGVFLKSGGRIPYPINIRHGEALELTLDLPAEFPDGTAFVPGGRFIYGGDASRFYRKHTQEVASFFIKATEVTVVEYLAFWKSLPSDELKQAYMSRVRFNSLDRHFVDAWNAEGELADVRLSLSYPVVGLSMEAVDAFCKWKGQQIGRTVRLPTAIEWEKAARGVDGRTYVWGNGYRKEANLTLTKYNAKGKTKYPYWAPPKKFRCDISIYNIYDMAGNVREMTSSLLPESTDLYEIKGGSGSTPQTFLPCAYSSDTALTPSDVGFRYLVERQKP